MSDFHKFNDVAYDANSEFSKWFTERHFEDVVSIINAGTVTQFLEFKIETTVLATKLIHFFIYDNPSCKFSNTEKIDIYRAVLSVYEFTLDINKYAEDFYDLRGG